MELLQLNLDNVPVRSIPNAENIRAYRNTPWIENAQQVNACISIEMQGYPNGYPERHG